MSIFDKIKSAIFGRAHAAAPTAAPTAGAPTTSTSAPANPTSAGGSASPAPSASSTAAPSAQASGGSTGSGTQGANAASPAPSSAPTYPAQPTPSASAQGPVNVETILDEAVKKKGQKLDWRHSIVDLMKALDMEASLSERRELADELGYDGDSNDSAKMNMWLHKALMKQLSQNGGKVPAELLD